MIDNQALLLDLTYEVTFGVPAVITTKSGAVIPCLILDHRDGVNVTAARGRQTVLVPGTNAEDANVFVRHSECPDKPSGGSIVINGEPTGYRIKSAKQKGANGIGEWQLQLEEIRP